MEYRAIGKIETRDADEQLIIEGYFSVFNTIYEMWSGYTETVAPGAFTKTLENNDDVRALIDHDTRLVLGRNTAGTLELREDNHGLWGRIVINPKDSEAVNLYERVKRGDVSQCSFGFEITNYEIEYHDDDSMHRTIKEVKLYEVSVCTFPAYTETSVVARSREKETEDIQALKVKLWREAMTKKLKGVN